MIEGNRVIDSTEPVDVRGVKVAPRDVVAATLPNPATLGERMTGRTCAGTWVRGTLGLSLYSTTRLAR